jgi:hypothetical protein
MQACVTEQELKMIKYLQHLRMFQSKQTFRLLCGIERLPGGAPLLRFLVHWRATAPILDLLLGYHRTFDSLEDAEAAIRSYGGLGHETKEYIEDTTSAMRRGRPSYYAMMFHMQRINLTSAVIPECSSTHVIDIWVFQTARG